MGDPVGAEEGNNLPQKKRGASCKIAWNKRLRQKRAGGMIKSGRPEVIPCVCLRGSRITSWSVCRGRLINSPSGGHSPGCSKVTLTLPQSGGVSPEVPGALHLDT